MSSRCLVPVIAALGSLLIPGSLRAALPPARPLTIHDTSPQWVRVLPNTPVTPYLLANSIYDSANDRLVIFGRDSGGDPSDFGNDVWTLNLDLDPRWRILAPTGSRPSMRGGATGIYDPDRRRMLLFGGFDYSSSPFGYPTDLWSLSLDDGPHWTRLDPQGTPPPGRFAVNAVYESNHDCMLFFGGVRQSGQLLGDVWALSLADPPTWTAIAPLGAGPGPRAGHFTCYDPVGERLLVFGGWNDTGTLQDLWALSLSGVPTWTPITMTGDVPAVEAFEAGYDPSRRMMILTSVGAPTYTLVLSTVIVGETTAAWTRRFPTGALPSECCALTTFDTRRGQLLRHSLFDDYHEMGEVWRLETGDAVTWSLLSPAGDFPKGRNYGPCLVYDSRRDRALMFWGDSNYNGGDNDVWALSFGPDPQWSRLRPTPNRSRPLRYSSAIYDPVRNRVLAYGGWDNGPQSDVWALGLNGTPGWTRVTTTGDPAPSSAYPVAVYDPALDRMIVISDGGHPSGWTFTPTVWSLALESGTWSRLETLGETPALNIGDRGAFDPIRRRVVLSDGILLDLTAPPRWLSQQAVGGPSQRRMQNLIYDPVQDRMICFGGIDRSNRAYSDVWSLTLGDSPAWIALAATGTPPVPRLETAGGFDPVRRRLLIFGGLVNDPPDYPNEVAALVLGDLPTSTLLARFDAEPSGGGILVTWILQHPGEDRLDLERSTPTEAWIAVATGMRQDDGEFLDSDVDAGTPYRYRLMLRLANGARSLLGSVEATAADLGPAIRIIGPNPSRSGVRVEYRVAVPGRVRIAVFDLQGREIGVLADGVHASGRFEVEWNANSEGQATSAGVYFLRCEFPGSLVEHRSFVIMR